MTFLLAIDGCSSSGTSTLAAAVVDVVPGAAVVHTDDTAWHHAVLDWDHLLAEHVIGPLRRGEQVSYRPPGWIAKDRPGAVTVPAGAPVVSSRAWAAPGARWPTGTTPCGWRRRVP